MRSDVGSTPRTDRASLNRHGFVGVRKRTDGRARPYYARLTLPGGRYLYSKDFETAEQAGAEFERLKRSIGSALPSPGDDPQKRPPVRWFG